MGERESGRRGKDEHGWEETEGQHKTLQTCVHLIAPHVPRGASSFFFFLVCVRYTATRLKVHWNYPLTMICVSQATHGGWL